MAGIVAGLTTQDEQARLHRRQAHPAGAAQHQRLHPGRALGEPEGHHHRRLHRRLVAAGQGGRGGQQPDRPGRRRADHARRFAQGHRRDRREAAASSSPATTPARRRSRPRATSPAPSGTGRKIYTDYVDQGADGQEPARTCVRGGLKEGFVKMSPYGAAVSADAKTKADEAKAKLTEGTLVIYKGPLKDNKGKVVIPAGQGAGADRHRAREDELPGRGRGRDAPAAPPAARAQGSACVATAEDVSLPPTVGVGGVSAARSPSRRSPTSALPRRPPPPTRQAASRRAALARSSRSLVRRRRSPCARCCSGGSWRSPGANPLAVYSEMFRGAFGTWFSLQNTLLAGGAADADRPVRPRCPRASGWWSSAARARWCWAAWRRRRGDTATRRRR